MEAPKTYVFFGIVGAGKGTQVDLLMKLLAAKDSRKIVYAYPGSEYRALTSGESFTGSIVKAKLERGELQPDFLTVGVFTNILVRDLTADAHLIADGYPRTLAQEEAFVAAMDFYGRENVEIVYIEVSKDEVIARMKLRGRSDDTDDGITRRFYEYETNVIPAMQMLKEHAGYKLHTINGAQSIEAVHADIVKALGL
jgi:adenylate kinase